MAGAADLKENLVLILELDLLVVEPSREIHRAIHREQLLARKAWLIAPLAAFVLIALPSLRRCRLGRSGRRRLRFWQRSGFDPGDRRRSKRF